MKIYLFSCNYPTPLPFRGSSRLCVIIFAYGTLKCLLGKTFRTILRIFYRYRPRFHTETRRAI
ncbi:Alkaline phosphatase [Microcystis panniformis FACHB-1757]|uniref:Alkaline phosphatase n=1 Tax=Microcystis panniformis FACHB-1757 TaxID=1638788 RepID=A0A0K1S6H2_9CHRO|nr:Alkaline phosphatase [Microcystis panniformis FACHB-1757]